MIYVIAARGMLGDLFGIGLAFLVPRSLPPAPCLLPALRDLRPALVLWLVWRREQARLKNRLPKFPALSKPAHDVCAALCEAPFRAGPVLMRSCDSNSWFEK